MRIKKILDFKKSCVAIACTLSLTVAMGISCFASTSTTFKVNNVSITGKISYTDTNDYNPLAKDSVTAKSSSIGIGFRGVGNHGASHNGNSGSGTTGVNW